jgi:hypothetical protein
MGISVRIFIVLLLSPVFVLLNTALLLPVFSHLGLLGVVAPVNGANPVVLRAGENYTICVFGNSEDLVESYSASGEVIVEQGQQRYVLKIGSTMGDAFNCQLIDVHTNVVARELVDFRALEAGPITRIQHGSANAQIGFGLMREKWKLYAIPAGVFIISLIECALLCRLIFRWWKLRNVKQAEQVKG